MRIRAINLMALTTCLLVTAVGSEAETSAQQPEAEKAALPSDQIPDNRTIPDEPPPPTSPPEPGLSALQPLGSEDAGMSNGALGGVVDLLRAGVEEEVLLKHIQNSQNSFNVSSDDIVFLTDVGTPGHVINAMMDRDRELLSEGTVVTRQTEEREPWPAAGTVVEVPAAEAVSYPYTEPTFEGDNTADQNGAQDEISVDYFHGYLAPYGTWIDVPEYGLCWQPTVAVSSQDWRPYADRGRWMYTDNGWYWYSDYSWGWAAFHYGRWFHHTRWGWCWAPGTVWGPSWVSWRYSDPFCGWAPLPPYSRSGFYFSVGISWGIPSWCYTYVPSYRICHSYPRRHAVPYHEARDIHGKSRTRNHYAVGRNHTIENRGIPPEQLTENQARDIRKASIEQRYELPTSRVRGEWLGDDGKTLTVYQPRRARGTSDGTRGVTEPRPGQVTRSGTPAARSPRREISDTGDRTSHLSTGNQTSARSPGSKTAGQGALRDEQRPSRSTQANQSPVTSSDRTRTVARDQRKRTAGQPAVSQTTPNSPRAQSPGPRTSQSSSQRPKDSLVITGQRDLQRTESSSTASRVTTRTTSTSRAASPSSRTRTATVTRADPARSTTRTQPRTIQTPSVSRGVPTAQTRSPLQARRTPTATTRSAPSIPRYSVPRTRPSTVAPSTQRTSPARTPTRSVSTPSRPARSATPARSGPTVRRAPQRTPSYAPRAPTRSAAPSTPRSAPRSAPPSRSSDQSGGRSR